MCVRSLAREVSMYCACESRGAGCNIEKIHRGTSNDDPENGRTSSAVEFGCNK